MPTDFSDVPTLADELGEKCAEELRRHTPYVGLDGEPVIPDEELEARLMDVELEEDVP